MSTKMNSLWKVAFLAGGSAIACSLAYKYVKYMDNKVEKAAGPHINEVLMQGGEEDAVKRETLASDHLYSLTFMVSRARKTVDVCLPRLVNSSIIQCLMFVAEKGRRVRLIIHSDRSKEQKGYLKELKDCGVEVKLIDPREKLEHEFILVDGVNEKSKDMVALVGSLNYPNDDMPLKYDSTLVTSEPSILQTLNEEFSRLWNTDEFNVDFC